MSARAFAPLVLAAWIAGCGGAVVVPAATHDDARRVAAQFPDVTAAELNHGRDLYLRKCSACHRPIAPASIAPDKWPEHVREMTERSGLGDGDAARIERYLVALATASQ